MSNRGVYSKLYFLLTFTILRMEFVACCMQIDILCITQKIGDGRHIVDGYGPDLVRGVSTNPVPPRLLFNDPPQEPQGEPELDPCVRYDLLNRGYIVTEHLETHGPVTIKSRD